MPTKILSQAELDSLPQCEASFEQLRDGSISFVFKVTGIRSVEEACALAAHLKSPICESYAGFYGELPMISSAVH